MSVIAKLDNNELMPSIIGQATVKLSTSGVVRPGIKVLTKSAQSNAAAKSFYDAGVAAGASYDAIAKRIKEKCGIDWSLTPRNVPYFTVRRSDFSMKEMADQFFDLYAEDRGEGRHIYKFPVIFPMDIWQTCMPHSLKCFTASGLKYWSEYDNNRSRYCKTYKPTEINPKNSRAIRTFGGRPTTFRNENNGLCEPDKCPEYQARKCNLTGSLLFYVPGVSGTSVIKLPTTSFYSLDQFRAKMESVAFARGGLISGLINGKPIFYLTKQHKSISMLDPETGQPKKVKQWIAVLEADIDVARLMLENHDQSLLEFGAKAADAFDSESGMNDEDFEDFPAMPEDMEILD